jgi:rubrerythrin
MGIWSRLFRFRRSAADEASAEDTPAPTPPADEAGNTVELPSEPFVFECQSCGKVFEARRKRPRCPECDSRDVSLLSG